MASDDRKPESPKSPTDPSNNPFLTGSIADIDRSITSLVNLRSMYPRTRPEYNKWVCLLANERWARYELSRDKQDSDKGIVHCTEAILLMPVSWVEHPGNVVRLLFSLANRLLERFRQFEQPKDVKYSIEYLRYLRGLALDSLHISRNDVISSLTRALASQDQKSEAGSRARNIKEMLILCRELLTSNVSADFPVAAFRALSGAINIECFQGQGRVDAQLGDQIVDCVRDAVKMCPPDFHFVFYALACTLRTRFAITDSNDDYKEATALVDKILDPNQPGECPDEIWGQTLLLGAELALVKFNVCRKPQYSELAISRLRTALSSPSIPELQRPLLYNALARQVRI